MIDPPQDTEPEAIEQLIVRVLHRAHAMAKALDRPNEARTILHLAQSFAYELANADPRFDRLRFIDDATQDPS